MALKRTVYSTLALMALGLALAPCISGVNAQTSPPLTSGIQAITKPSKDVSLSFIRPGRVVEMDFKEGESVKAGAVIARQDDSEEQKAAAIDESNAKDQTEFKLDNELRKLDQIDLDKIMNIPGASAYEQSQARQKVLVDDARIEKSVQTTETAKLKYQETLALIEKLKVESPIDGVVSDTYIRVGEVADGQNMKAMRIVQVDPLWVEAMVPILKARELKTNDSAGVTFSDGKNRPGKVVLVWPVGDSGSGTIKVRIEVPNPEKLQPGENVRVTFNNDVAAAKGPN